MTANVSGIGSVLQQMQSMAAQASGGVASPTAALAGSGAATAGTF
ncbi:flagellar hook-basal body complex protein FliE, partial [Burkholderia sp. Se-20378]|nr:flagellar hook-basal body complex protein FliE [Burkholderia sp. Se-20378]